MPIEMTYQEPPVVLTLTARQALAVAAALRITDDELLAEEGLLAGKDGVLDDLQDAFEIVDGAVSDRFGDDWPALVTDLARLAEEAEQGQEDTEED